MDSGALADAQMAERAYEALGEEFSLVVALIGTDLTVLWTNPSAHRVLRQPEGALIGQNAADYIHPDDLEHFVPVAGEMAELAEGSEETLTPSSPVELPVRVLAADGSWSEMTATGRVLGTDGVMLAVLRPAAERHAFDAVLDGLGSGAQLDRALGTVLGLTRAQFPGGGAWAVHDAHGSAVVVSDSSQPFPFEPAALMEELRARDDLGGVQVKDGCWLLPIRTADEGELVGALAIPALRAGGPSPWDELIARRTTSLAAVAFTRDRVDRLLRQAATTDHLTGLMNRREFESLLERSSASGPVFPTSLFFIDLDGFKVINDELGHMAGDEVLVTVAKRIRSAVRSADHVGRIGGDEFVVCCSGLPTAEVEPTRRRISSAVGAPMALEQGVVTVCASVGVATARNQSEFSELIDRSDADMFARKRAGRSSVERGGVSRDARR